VIAYLGHDDLWLPHHLDRLVAAIDSGADMAFGLTRMVPSRPDLQRGALLDTYAPGAWIVPTATIHRHTLTDRLGGWKDFRGLAMDPEQELWSRFHAAGARFEAVRRLTAVKFPADVRRSVYRERPSHEQAAWLERIRREPDFEVVELGRMACEMAATGRTPHYRSLVGEVLRRGVGGVARRLGLSDSGFAPGERIARRRAFKGLAPAASAPGSER
jgi:hypothetical protein